LDGKLVYHHAEEGHHHHLICRNCGSVFECREETLRPLADALRINYSFNPDLHHLLISGVCLRCHK
jgi:Fur family ferric uptake transcriptional regulator